MSEEEKNAIEILKTFVRRRRTKNYNKIDYGDVEATEIVLNLIEKQEKEIERIKSLDIYKLVEDWEKGELVSKDKIKEFLKHKGGNHFIAKVDIEELLKE